MLGGYDLDGTQDYGQDSGPFSDINVTPLVDVMLVLLVVFMMAAPLMIQGIAIDLPKSAGKPLGQAVTPVVVSLARDGSLYLRNEKLLPEDLATRIDRLRAVEGDAIVYVRGDRSVAYGEVMDVIARFGAAGFTHVSLLSLPAPKSP